MDTLIETYQHLGQTIELHMDDCGDHECPLEYDNDGVRFVTFERNSTLSDYHDFSSPEDAADWANDNGFEMFNLFKYEHGRVAYAITGFGCPWDSGQAGYILVRTADYCHENSPTTAKIAQGMADMVTTWCNGDYCGFVVQDSQSNNVDSCWGFDSAEYCKAEAESAAEHYAREARKAHQKQAMAF